jgi:hypothetical protein
MNHFLNFPGSLSDPRGWYWSRLVLGWYLLVWAGQAVVGMGWSSSGWYGNEFGGIASSMGSG